MTDSFEVQSEDDDGDLRRMLVISEAFDADLCDLLQRAWNTTSLRSTICMAYCRAALEHTLAQRVLIEARLSGSALSLVRLQFETVVRAAWVLHAAKIEWLTKFSESVLPGDTSEPQMGPPIPAMIEAIGVAAHDASLELKRLNGTIKVMHSFVHGGVHLVVHALRGYPATNMVSVLQNRNLLSLMLVNVIVIASGSPDLAGAMQRMAAAHATCMPPVRDSK